MIATEVQTREKHSETAPAVSVIIPAFNAARYIGEALDSVFAQTFSSHEIIVINDGALDTGELERELEKYRDGIRYIKQENQGAAAARNAGLRAARGEFVAFLDADDIWLPNFLEEQMQLLRLSNVDVVYSDAVLSGESPVAGRTFMQIQPSRGAVTPESLLTVDVAILTSTVLARKKPIFEVGLFDEALKRGHDFDLWLRLAKLGVCFAYQDKVLAEHRIVESGLSGNMISQLKRSLAVLEAIRSKEVLTANENAALQATLNRTLRDLALEDGKQKLLCKDFAGARRSFHEATRFRQSWKLVIASLGLRIAPETVRWVYNRRNGGANRSNA